MKNYNKNATKSPLNAQLISKLQTQKRVTKSVIKQTKIVNFTLIRREIKVYVYKKVITFQQKIKII